MLKCNLFSCINAIGFLKEKDSNTSMYTVEPLHKVPHLIDECCDLINNEWKRSKVARLKSIENSSDNFPMSLLLLKNSKNPKVIGHCKLSRISLSKNKIFVETVVIHPNFRGKGLGKFLMNEMEEFVKRKDIRTIYLSTRGQEGFYEKLGYSICLPISIYGCHLGDSNENISIHEGFKHESSPNLNNNVAPELNISSTIAPPPPPLPVPTKPTTGVLSAAKTFMKKNI